MPPRYSATPTISFGPGRLTPAIKALVIANVVMFVISTLLLPGISLYLGFVPQQVLLEGRVWQLFTYMFLHVGIFHILFNMLTLWMFGVELERKWGSRYLLKYYFVAGVGAAVTQILASFAPLAALQQLYYMQTVGASGAIYGILLAYAMYFPTRIIYLYFFPVEARYAVMIMGAISLYSSMEGSGGIAHATHLGGLLAGYLYLKQGRIRLPGGRLRAMAEIKYRYAKWRIGRSRRRFDVYSGGRGDDVNRRIH